MNKAHQNKDGTVAFHLAAEDAEPTRDLLVACASALQAHTTSFGVPASPGVKALLDRLNANYSVLYVEEKKPAEPVFTYCDACSMSIVKDQFVEIEERVICDDCMATRFCPDNYPVPRTPHKATPKQLDYLHGLGWGDLVPITKSEASRLIGVFRIVQAFIEDVVKAKAGEGAEALSEEDLAKVAGAVVSDWSHVRFILSLQAKRWKQACARAEKDEDSNAPVDAYLPPIAQSAATTFVWKQIAILRPR